MDPLQLLLLAIVIYGLAALAGWLLPTSSRSKSPSPATLAAGWLGLLASLIAVLSAGLALGSGSVPFLALFPTDPFGSFTLQLDALSAFLVGLIGLVGIGTSLYSLGCNLCHASVNFFTNIFMAAMLLVVTIANTFYFLVFWELMTLVSYFLVVWETKNEKSVRTGYIYMLVAHAGAALIMVAFLLLYFTVDSFNFGVLRQTWLSPGIKNLVFILAFLGFGAKAGMVPLHFWTPGAYSAAPNHVSALMAGVMKKTAIYGILRICVDLLGVPVWWWGFLVMVFGVISIVIGAYYALSEREIKRVLAYSSVENVGIILMGVGMGMVGLAQNLPVLAILGFLAALYHTLNHAFFKGLLFLGAGSVIDQTGTQNLNQMGGLGRRMPWTGLAFLVGALAVAAIPPFNGFVSEWFTYQAFLTASQTALFAMRVFAPLFAVLMALAGALAVMVYIKVYGSAFAGPAHSQPAAVAHESQRAKLVGMGYMVLGCLTLGLLSPLIAPWIAYIAARFARVAPLTVASGWLVFPADPVQAVLSVPLVAILLIGLLVVPLILVAAYGGNRASQKMKNIRSDVDPWSCGYGYKPVMSVSASSFDQPVREPFQPIYWLRTLMDEPFRRISAFSQRALEVIRRSEPVVEMVVTRPTHRVVETAGQWIQALQTGDIRVYCFYIILTLAILLIAIFGRSGL